MSKSRKNMSSVNKRFRQSQAAHLRLKDLYARRYKKDEKDVNLIRNGYHNDVFKKQERYGRLLTDSEKKKVYKLSEYYFYN